MSDINWYWARGEQQSAAMTLDELKKLLSTGKVTRGDLVWNQNMPQWAPPQQVPELSGLLPPASAGPAVGYYSPGGGLPPHAAAALRGHAAPLGDVGDWPLDDSRVRQLEAAKKDRRPITNAVSLYRLLFIITVIATAIAGITMLGIALTSRRSVPAELIGIGVAGTICVAFCVLYYFVCRSTQRSQAWAPLTMGIIFLAGAALNVASIAAQSVGNSGNTGPAMATGLVGILFGGAFAWVSFSAWKAIGRYRRHPAWCQEVLAVVENRGKSI